MCDSAARRPSSQITLGKLVINIIIIIVVVVVVTVRSVVLLRLVQCCAVDCAAGSIDIVLIGHQNQS